MRPGGRSGGIRLSLAHSRKPPRKAFALWPARQRGGSASSSLTLPPPITVSSGRSAAVRRPTTSATRRRHFFLVTFQSGPSHVALIGGFLIRRPPRHRRSGQCRVPYPGPETAFSHPRNRL